MSYTNELHVSFGNVHETVESAIDEHPGIFVTFSDIMDVAFEHDRELYDRFSNFEVTVVAREVIED